MRYAQYAVRAHSVSAPTLVTAFVLVQIEEEIKPLSFNTKKL